MLKYKLPYLLLLSVFYQIVLLSCLLAQEVNENQRGVRRNSFRYVPINQAASARSNDLRAASPVRGIRQTSELPDPNVGRVFPALAQRIRPKPNSNLKSGVNFLRIPLWPNGKYRVEHDISSADRFSPFQLYRLRCQLSEHMKKAIRDLPRHKPNGEDSSSGPFRIFAEDYMYLAEPFTFFISNQGQAYMFVKNTYDTSQRRWKTECQTQKSGLMLHLRPIDRYESRMGKIHCMFTSTAGQFATKCLPFHVQHQLKWMDRRSHLIHGKPVMDYSKYRIYTYNSRTPFQNFLPNYANALVTPQEVPPAPLYEDRFKDRLISPEEERLLER